MAIDRSFHILYSSDWAAHSAMSNYNASQDKISVVSFGDSLNAVPSFNELSYRKLTDTCKLLFIGSNWERKGGPLAMEIYNQMLQHGLKSLLSIVGCNPEIQPQKGIRIYPFLDKANAIDNDLLYQLYMESDFLLLPTRADCTPVVFSEAAAFGLPVITTDTGGIKSVIHNGENGFYLPIEAGAEMYVDLISKIMDEKPQRISLQSKSREAYESRLNWNHWLETFNLITRSLRIN
jgi:glycosyltransferase involved in cell wall biosynthesis